MSLEDNIVKLITALEAHGAALVKHAEAIVKGAVTKGKKAAAAEPEVVPDATPPAGATALVTTLAPVVTMTALQPAAAPVVAGVADAAQLNATTEAVIKLANDYSRDEALAILSKVRADRPGVTRCSDLNKLDLVDVYTEATAAITRLAAAATAAKANASLI